MPDKLLYRSKVEIKFPVFRESDQQILWLGKASKAGIILLYLRELALKEENLKSLSPRFQSVCSAVAWCAVATSLLTPEYSENWRRAEKHFKETGKIEGALFLTPDLRKVWISYFGIKYLKEISS